MGIFSSSWKYQAYAASVSLFDENDHPQTFQTVMLEGLRMDDTFANILAYTWRTDMYARTRAMVRYATKEVNPYIRGLPTSDFATFEVRKEWIDSAILREIKMPMLDFYWMVHGHFDADYVVNKFIHDHYMDINYFPWPEGCLGLLENPNFDDGDVGWDKTDFIIDETTRVAEMTADGGTCYNQSVGPVTPGEIISLRAVCDRGADGQTGSINLTFYSDAEATSEISTESAINDSTLAGAWELLTVIATVPGGAVTAKAWASGELTGAVGFEVFNIVPEAGGSWVIVQINFYPSSPANGGFDLSYISGTEPNNEWLIHHKFTEIEHDGNDQIWVKVDQTARISGFQDTLLWYQGGNIGEWVDLWDNWELEFHDDVSNGIPEIITINVSIAKDDGGGAPDLATVVVYPMQLTAYQGYKDYTFQQTFSASNGDLVYRPPEIDRRDYGAGDDTSEWRDLYGEQEDWDHGYMYLYYNEVVSRTGVVDDVAIYAIDAKITDFQYGVVLEWDATSGGSGGIIGRLQDISNFWLLAVKNPADTDPILGLYKVVADVHTLEASKVLTGFGPFTSGSYPMRLTFEGNNITGELDVAQAGKATYEPLSLIHTNSTYNTETDVGIWADGIDTIFNDMSLYEWPIGYDAIVWDTSPITASDTGCGRMGCLVYFYEQPVGQTSDPYNSTCGYGTPQSFEDVIDWRSVWFNVDTFVFKVSAVSGDTGQIEIYEYGSTLTAFNVWMDLYRSSVWLYAEESTSVSAVVDITVAIDDGTKNPIAGTEVTKRVTINSTSTGPCT